MSQELTAAEAAARLGVKRATLYAYVSRGLLQRHLALDGRTSRFDADEIDAFRSGRRRATEGELDTVISTSLTRVRDGDLRLRGQDLVALVAEGHDFEAVADLALGGQGGWSLSAEVLAAVRRAQQALPEASAPLERLRVTTGVLSALDPLRFDPAPAAVRSAGRALLVAMVDGLPDRGRGPKRGRLADRLWPRLTDKRGSAEQRAALNASLALLVDHGLAASTFGARIAASVRADPYSIVSAGLGVLGGTLHGAASRAVAELLRAAHDAEDASAAVGEA